MLAQHSYLAQGPGDLEFSKGDLLDVLSEGSSPVPSAGCTGVGFWTLLQGGTGEEMAPPVLFGSYSQEVQACTGFCPELIPAMKTLTLPDHMGQGLFCSFMFSQ